MTKKDVSEVFYVWSLNWPAAEMFQGGQELLNARITLYANRLKDVDYWYGKQAASLAVDTRRFPPSIAEYRDDIETVMAEVRARCAIAYDLVINTIAFAKMCGMPLQQALDELPPVSKAVIERMGGWSAFAPKEQPFLNKAGFDEAFLKLEKETDGLPPGKRQLPKS